MQQHLGRLDGVSKVDVSLIDGKVTILPQEDGLLDPAAVYKATFDSGVTLAEMKITARGSLRNDPQKGWLFVLSPAQSFPIVANEAAKTLESRPGPVVLTGILYRKPKGKDKRKELLDVRIEIVAQEKN